MSPAQSTADSGRVTVVWWDLDGSCNIFRETGRPNLAFHAEAVRATCRQAPPPHGSKPERENFTLPSMYHRNRVLESGIRVSVLGALLLLVLPAVAVTDLESRAREIDNKLMAPCCGANTVREHDSGAAMQMRAEIRQMLADGKTEKEILDHFVGIYGEKILALPEARGFNLLAYLIPAGFLIFGALFLALALRRWRSQPNVAVAAANAPPPDLDPAYLERLRNEIEKGS